MGSFIFERKKEQTLMSYSDKKLFDKIAKYERKGWTRIGSIYWGKNNGMDVLCQRMKR